MLFSYEKKKFNNNFFTSEMLKSSPFLLLAYFLKLCGAHLFLIIAKMEHQGKKVQRIFNFCEHISLLQQSIISSVGLMIAARTNDLVPLAFEYPSLSRILSTWEFLLQRGQKSWTFIVSLRVFVLTSSLLLLLFCSRTNESVGS